MQLSETFYRETQTARQMVQNQSTKFLVPTRLRYPIGSSAPPRLGFNIANRALTRDRMARASADSALDARVRGQEIQTAVNLQNEQTQEWNRKICGILTASTGFQLPPEPADWWKWWTDYNLVAETAKEYQYIRYSEVAAETLQMAQIVPIQPHDGCLVAGTPVWTDRGAVAVETVQVGDLVLAKDAKTGELAYQPVLRTTIRNAQPVLKVTTPKGQLCGTYGHTFWISGQGWTKLRDVKPGQQFHAIDGPVEILRLEEAAKEKVYNMIVANVHTYFTGPELILSYDVTIAEPVDAIIPGYIKP